MEQSNKLAAKDHVRVAVIDMNNGHPNQGMRGILEILNKYEKETGMRMETAVFGLRDKGEIPDLSHDIYISSGGPGSPYDGANEQWERDFFDLLDKIEGHNTQSETKKYVFLICHSFQLACIKYGLGKVTNRRSTAFGIFPIHLTSAGQSDPIFEGLGENFFSVDSRDWQVIEPISADFEARGAHILAIEKERPHVALERCIMAIRFSDEMVGTQFHPEADPEGMKMYLALAEKKELIIKNHGEAKYEDMVQSVHDPARIVLTQRIILPNFLHEAVGTMTHT